MISFMKFFLAAAALLSTIVLAAPTSTSTAAVQTKPANETVTLETRQGSINGWVQNHCSFGFFVWTDAYCPGSSCSSPAIWVPGNGGGYQAAYQPIPNSGGGVTIKFALSAEDKWRPTGYYQAEYSIRNNRVWYNWSGLNGNPLGGVRRSMQVGDGRSCPNSICLPGSSSCDWYAKDGLEFNVYTCNAMDVVLAIC